MLFFWLSSGRSRAKKLQQILLILLILSKGFSAFSASAFSSKLRSNNPTVAVPENLQEFLEALEARVELLRVQAEVDPELEITEIVTRVVKAKGPALLFERVKGSPYPLCINVFGSEKRLEIALGRTPAEIGAEILKAIRHDGSGNLR